MIAAIFPDGRGKSWPRHYAELAYYAEQLGCTIELENHPGSHARRKVEPLELARFCVLSLIASRARGEVLAHRARSQGHGFR